MPLKPSKNKGNLQMKTQPSKTYPWELITEREKLYFKTLKDARLFAQQQAYGLSIIRKRN